MDIIGFIGLSVGFIGLFVSFILLIIALIRKKSKRLYAIGMVVSFVLFIVGIGMISSNTTEPIKKESATKESTTKKSVAKAETILKGIDDEIIVTNIANASQQIGLDIKKAKKVKLVGKWAGGDIYSLTYEGTGIEIYLYGDKTVNSINVGNTHVYEDGFEPLPISDYLLQTDDSSNLQLLADRTVKSALKYPSTADFSWLGWGYSRVKDIYIVSGSVTAKNAFGVESEMSFYIEYKKNNSQMSTEYFVLDGKAVKGNKSAIVEPKRKEIPTKTKTNSSDGSFELVYGNTGKYGEKIKENGNEYIVYNVPQGTYKVTTSMNICVVIVVKKASYKNSEGYTEHAIVSMNRFNADVKSLDITVKEGERVTLMANAKVTFTPHK